MKNTQEKIDELNQIYENTKQELINQHGENKVGMLNGKKYISRNEYLNSFVHFSNAIFAAADAFNLDLTEQIPALAAIFKFCEDAEYKYMEAAANRINFRLSKLESYPTRKFKTKFVEMFEEINSVINQKNFKKSKISVIMADKLGVNFDNTEYDYKRHRKIIAHYKFSVSE